ncbi:MAG TPA: hypothetical protein VHX16_19580 [Chloroflexota bacterium]|nr:hypothetical protein [Chloroflexota bacterium]
MQAPDESIFIKLRDARITESRLSAELKSAREANEAQRIIELERQLATVGREIRETQAFLDLGTLPAEARMMISHYYGMVATDLTQRAQVAELNRYLPNPQAPRNQEAMAYLFQLWEQLHDAGVEVLPVGPLASTSDPDELKSGAELFGRLAIFAARG